MSLKECQVDSRTIRFPFPASTAVAVGDLLWNDSGVAAKASAQADQLTEAANQLLFKSLFLGVSQDQRLATETAEQDRVIVTDGVFDVTCPTGHAWVVGDYVAASEAGSGTALENQQVEYTNDANKAIGYCVENGATGDTTVRVRLISHYLPNTVNRTDLDATLADDTPLVLGSGSDANLLWSTADASNHAAVLALGDTNQALHITDTGAMATDWNIAATTDPNVYIHSNTTPATDYLRLGGHTGTAADIDVVGGTTLNFQIAGVTSMAVISGNVFIGDTANANSTVGLTINQGANDDLAFTLKSSDVSHGLTSIVTGTVEDDDYFTVAKFAAATGGVCMQALGENAAVTTNLRLESIGGQADATHTAAGRGLVEVYASQHDGANALADIGADGNAFAVRGRRGSADATLFIVDEDGEIHSDVTLNVFDTHDDISLVRAFDMVGERNGIVKNRWDEYVRDNEASLVKIGVLGAPIAQGGLVNHNRLMQLHNGALWQLHSDIMEVARHLPAEARAALPARMQERLAVA